MTLYEKIDLACRRGLCPIIRYGKNYCIISTEKDAYGEYRESGWYKGLTNTKENFWFDVGLGKNYWDQLEKEGAIMLDEYYTPPVKPYEVGEKVLYKYRRPLIVKGFEYDGCTFIYDLSFGDGMAIDGVCHEDLKPYFEETPTPHKEEKTKMRNFIKEPSEANLLDDNKIKNYKYYNISTKAVLDYVVDFMEDYPVKTEETLTERVARLEDELERVNSVLKHHTKRLNDK